MQKEEEMLKDSVASLAINQPVAQGCREGSRFVGQSQEFSGHALFTRDVFHNYHSTCPWVNWGIYPIA